MQSLNHAIMNEVRIIPDLADYLSFPCFRKWLTKSVKGAEFVRGVPQPRTRVPASDKRLIALHHP